MPPRRSSDGRRQPAPSQATDRRETGLELLRSGRAAVAEECVTTGQLKQVFLTTHRPVRIADRNLLLSSSADISEQKAVEDQLFRSAYYDELTDLPTRRVIEHRANSLLQRDETPAGISRSPFSTSTISSTSTTITAMPIGDALLVEVAKRLGLDLRESDMLSRISGDEFLLLLNPIQSEHEVAEYIRLHPAAAEGAVLHRRFGNIRLHLDRRQPLSRTRPQLRRAAPERRYRDVSRQERRQGRRGVLRRRHGARGAGADEDRAVAAAGHSGKALLLRLPAQGRHPDPGDQGHRGAGAAARRRGRDPGARHLHQSRGRARADRRTDPSGAGRDRQVDRPDQRNLRPAYHDQHQRRGQAGRQSRIHAVRSRRRWRRPDFPSAS